MQSSRKKVCDNCLQELSLSAYYRHKDNCTTLNKSYKSNPSAGECLQQSGSSLKSSYEEDSDAFVASSVSSSDTDSTFCLDGSDNGLSSENDNGCGMEVDFEYPEPNFNSSSDSDATLPSDDNEIWDDTYSDINSDSSNSDVTATMKKLTFTE